MSSFKNYLVFTGVVYYPGQGWEDFKASFGTREEAKKFVEKSVTEESDDWGQIVFIGDVKEELIIEYYNFISFRGDKKGEWNESTN